LWVHRNDGSFRDVATPAFAFPSNIRRIVAADFDNDGADEILFLASAEPTRLFRTEPAVHLLEPGAPVTPAGPVTAAVADLDSDGRPELLLAISDDPTVRYYRAVGPDYDWLRVQPLTRFGAPARGATVTLEGDSRPIVRVISGLGSVEPVAHFGLGPFQTAVRLTVTWSDGATSVLTPTPRQVLRVPYPGG
jgi:hypothetical protein